MKKEIKTDTFTIEMPPKPNFAWHIGENPNDLVIHFTVKKTFYNRFKWWISTKLFLPGWYKWDG